MCKRGRACVSTRAHGHIFTCTQTYTHTICVMCMDVLCAYNTHMHVCILVHMCLRTFTCMWASIVSVKKVHQEGECEYVGV
jgi:hypothetical protein